MDFDLSALDKLGESQATARVPKFAPRARPVRPLYPDQRFKESTLHVQRKISHSSSLDDQSNFQYRVQKRAPKDVPPPPSAAPPTRSDVQPSLGSPRRSEGTGCSEQRHHKDFLVDKP